MCGRGRVCGGANIIVFVYVHVRLCLFPCHTRKGAFMLNILNLEHTRGR